MPASRAAWTTAALRSSSMRIPKLLHPSPTSVTSSDPTFRISILGSIGSGQMLNAGSGSEARQRSDRAAGNLTAPQRKGDRGARAGVEGDPAEAKGDAAHAGGAPGGVGGTAPRSGC